MRDDITMLRCLSLDGGIHKTITGWEIEIYPLTDFMQKIFLASWFQVGVSQNLENFQE